MKIIVTINEFPPFHMETDSIVEMQPELIRWLYAEWDLRIPYIASLLGVSSRTVYRDIKRMGLKRKNVTKAELLMENIRLREKLKRLDQ